MVVLAPSSEEEAGEVAEADPEGADSEASAVAASAVEALAEAGKDRYTSRCHFVSSQNRQEDTGLQHRAETASQNKKTKENEIL